MRPSRDLTVYLTSSFRLRFSDWRTCQGTLHRLNQLSGSNGLIEKGEGTHPHRLGFDIRPPKCPRCKDHRHQRINLSRTDCKPVADVRHLKQENHHLMRQQPAEVEC